MTVLATLPTWVGVDSDALLGGFGVACAVGFLTVVPVVGLTIVRRLLS